jgi:phage-related protein
MALRTAADQSIQGEAVIDLTGLVLAPGDELTINTEDMTVTLDGQNGMDYFSLDSEFFTLLSGLNTLVFTDGETTRTIAFDIIWKDRWL